jgi:non-canonical (house-cleaning) NTP pyrophosphatase
MTSIIIYVFIALATSIALLGVLTDGHINRTNVVSSLIVGAFWPILFIAKIISAFLHL